MHNYVAHIVKTIKLILLVNYRRIIVAIH